MERKPKKRDYASYERFWDDKAQILLEQICGQYSVKVRPSHKRDVWDAYCRFNRWCSKNYMQNPDGRLDRHKVVACLIYAIVETSPIVITREANELARKRDSRLELYTLNERFAIRMGESLLRGFVSSHVNGEGSDGSPGNEEYLCLDSSLADGIDFDGYRVFHGETYYDNLAVSLYYTKCEMNYNILLLSDLVYQWECHTREAKEAQGE